MHSNQPLIELIPDIYQDFLPPLFYEPTPKETIATCHDCIMCKEWEQKKAKGERYFTPDGKCCTYFPVIPNYLLGALLNDTDAHLIDGQLRVKHLIDGRIGVTPLSIQPSIKYLMKYNAFSKLNFGLSKDLICPLNSQKTGNCTIWKHRNSVCSMWYCKSVGGLSGQKFWKYTQHYLGSLEHLLVRHTAKSLGIDVDHSLMKQVDDTEGNLKMSVYKELWGSWFEREQEYYKECHSIISKIDRSTFNDLFSDVLDEKYAKMELAHSKFK